jgi:hypothetical protein
VVERGRQPRLAQEALLEPLVLRQLGSQQLERDPSAEATVVGRYTTAMPPRLMKASTR